MTNFSGLQEIFLQDFPIYAGLHDGMRGKPWQKRTDYGSKG